MARKVYTTKEQVAIDKKTKEVADKKRNKPNRRKHFLIIWL